MEWWEWLSIAGGFVAILLGIPAAIHYSRRWKLDRAKDKKRQRKIFIRTREELLRIKGEIEQCKYPTIDREYTGSPSFLTYENATLRELSEGEETPKDLRIRLKSLMEILGQYASWLSESSWIIRAKIKEECETKEALLDLWQALNPYRANWSGTRESILPSVLENLKRELESFILPLIYEKRLNTEQVGKLLYNKYPDIEASIYEVEVGAGLFGERNETKTITITMEDFVKDKDFRKLIENLKELENRPSVQEARKYKEKSLFKINEVLEKV